MKRLLTTWLLLGLAAWGQSGPQVGIPAGGKLVPSTPTEVEPGGVKSQSCPGTDKMTGIDAEGNILCAADQAGAGGGVPAGAVVLILNGSCPATLGAGWSEVSSLSGKFVLGTVAANGDIAATGGSDSITPAGSVSQPSFTGSPVSTSSDSAGTPAGTVGAIAATATAAVAKGTSTTNVAAQTHTHPAPTFTGTALPAHAHTVTAAGTVSQPAFIGTAFDNRPAFVKVIFCRKD